MTRTSPWANGPRANFADTMNESLNQTLGRTLLTSLTTFLALVVVLAVAGMALVMLGLIVNRRNSDEA